jgi:hypothetical protein
MAETPWHLKSGQIPLELRLTGKGWRYVPAFPSFAETEKVLDELRLLVVQLLEQQKTIEHQEAEIQALDELFAPRH